MIQRSQFMTFVSQLTIFQLMNRTHCFIAMLHHLLHFPLYFLVGFNVGCRFNRTWLEKYPWLIYSPKLDEVFCGPCALLLPNSMSREDKGLLVNRPFSNWIKVSNALAKHSSLHYHQDCLAMADALKSSVDKPATRIDVMFSDAIKKTFTRMSRYFGRLCKQYSFSQARFR